MEKMEFSGKQKAEAMQYQWTKRADVWKTEALALILLTAVLSPIINSSLFGMPMPVVLPAILLKSVLLAIAAGWAAQRFGRISIPVLVGVVLTYQVVGTLGEWMYIGNFYNAIQDFRIGIPGMCLQVFGGYLFIKYLIRK